jgi:hypothetical protein
MTDLFWRKLPDEMPPMNEVIVCTDGKHRWLDNRIPGWEKLEWQGHQATHWHPLAKLPRL